MSAAWLGPIRQISYTTDDLDRLVAFWEQQVGVGPWSIYRGLTLQLRHEGRPVALPFDVALAMHGGQLIELIQVQGPGPSPFHDGLGRPLIGLQRLAAFSTDIERDAATAVARGMERYAEGVDVSGQRYVYLRSAEAPGVILELLEQTPSFDGFVDRLQARCQGYAAQQAPTAVAAAPTVAAAGTMRAALLHGYGDAAQFRLEDVPLPQPGPGQIRLRVAAAAVNPVDIKARRGELQAWMPLSFPARLGGDVSGIVEAVGAGVTALRTGDRVMGMINPLADGAYAQQLVAPAAAFVRVPEGLDLVDAAALPTGVLTGTQLVERGIRPLPGMRGLVTGAAGSSGRAALFAALDAGAEVWAGIRGAAPPSLAELPLAGLVDLSDAVAVAATGPFDFLADTVGGALAEALFARVRPQGRVASTAFPPPEPPAGSTQRYSALVVRFDGPRLERFARELLSRGRQMPVALRLPLAQVAEAHRRMEQGGVGGKILLLP